MGTVKWTARERLQLLGMFYRKDGKKVTSSAFNCLASITLCNKTTSNRVGKFGAGDSFYYILKVTESYYFIQRDLVCVISVLAGMA